MCGRARCTLSPDAVTRATGARPDWRDQHLFRPSFNVAPGTFLPVVCAAASAAPSASPHAASASAKLAPAEAECAEDRCAEAEEADEEGRAQGEIGGGRGKAGEAEQQEQADEEQGVQAEEERKRQVVEAEGEQKGQAGGEVEVQVMKWGLVPSFCSKTQPPDHFRMFNARCESLHAKPSFRRLLPSQRCVVVLEGFYEWKKEGSKKQPFYIHISDGRPMVMAGLFDCWRDAQGERLFTFTIVTTASSQRLQWLHDRMPAILPSQHHVAAWLHGKLSGPDAIAHLCSPYNHPDLVWHAVTPEVGKPAFNGPQCVQPISLKPALSSTPITQLFARKRQKTPPTDAVGTGGVDKQEAEAGGGALEEGHRVKGEEGGSEEEKQLAGVQEAPVEAGAGADEGDGASEEQAKGGSSGNEQQEGAGEQRIFLTVRAAPTSSCFCSPCCCDRHFFQARASPVVEATTASEGGSSERRTDAGLAGERPAQTARGDGSARRPAAESRETGAEERSNELSDDEMAEAKEEAGLEMEEEEEDSFLAHWSWAGWVRDVVELRFLENETAVRRSMPPLPPQYPASARASARGILAGDAGYVRALGEVARWWAESWRVPLQYEYDPADVAHYFNRRPHIVLLRTLKVRPWAWASTWLG
ncbi:unnamed protein product [Closterium sp. NIES-64]|nr:unnamed protein product [Closterium sp. NIES-64]